MKDLLLGKKSSCGDLYLKEENRKLNNLILGGLDIDNNHLLDKLLENDISDKSKGFIYFDTKGDKSSLIYAMAKKERRHVHYISSLFEDVKIDLFNGELKIILRKFDNLIDVYFKDSPMFFISVYKELINAILLILGKTNNLNQENFMKILEDKKFYLNLQRKTLVDLNKPFSYLNEYHLENSKLKEHTVGIVSLMNKLFNDIEIGHLFKKKDLEKDCTLIDFSKNDVYIINLDTLHLSKANKWLLKVILFNEFYYSLNKENGWNLYIDDLSEFKLFKEEIFYMSKLKNIHLTIISDNLCIDEKEELFLAFQNIFITNKLNYKDLLFIQDIMYNRNFVSEKLLGMDDEDYFYYIYDKNERGYKSFGILTLKKINDEDMNFYKKRIKRYEKEFSKKEK